MVIYVAGKYHDNNRDMITKNIRIAEEYGKLILLAGHTPVIPHKITSYWNEDYRFKEWDNLDFIKKFCLPLLHKCDALFLIPNWIDSYGAKIEKEYAEKNDIPIIYSLKELDFNLIQFL